MLCRPPGIFSRCCGNRFSHPSSYLTKTCVASYFSTPCPASVNALLPLGLLCWLVTTGFTKKCQFKICLIHLLLVKTNSSNLLKVTAEAVTLSNYPIPRNDLGLLNTENFLGGAIRDHVQSQSQFLLLVAFRPATCCRSVKLFYILASLIAL